MLHIRKLTAVHCSKEGGANETACCRWDKDVGFKGVPLLRQMWNFSGQPAMHGGLSPRHTVLPREGFGVSQGREKENRKNLLRWRGPPRL